MTNFQYSIGIDVSKTQLDLFDERNQAILSFPNTDQGIQQLLGYLQECPSPSVWHHCIRALERLRQQASQ